MLIACHSGLAQASKNQLVRTLTVADGLPQSVVSGIVQDSVGFIWIGTRDGLARYDGIKFKIFRHIPGDSSTVASNTISLLYKGGNNRLWVLYETGDIDIINTATEIISHITRPTSLKQLKNVVRPGHSITEDTDGNGWLLSDSSVFMYDPVKQKLTSFPFATWGMAENKPLGIAFNNGNIVFTTQSGLVTIKKEKVIAQLAFVQHENNIPADQLYTCQQVIFRKNKQAVVQYDNELLVYDPDGKCLHRFAIDGTDQGTRNMIADNDGNIYFYYNATIYLLTANNTLNIWRPRNENPALGFKSILLDRSGVLWLGSNGAGIQLFDLRLSRLQPVSYKINFIKDLFKNGLKVSDKIINSIFSGENNAFSFRFTYNKQNRIIFTEADRKPSARPMVFIYGNGNIDTTQWRYADNSKKDHQPINAFACSNAGKIWGINFSMQPVYFDINTYTAKEFEPIVPVGATGIYVTGLVMEGEDAFWISTGLNGLYFYDRIKNKTIHYEADEKPGSLPTNQLVNIVQDRRDKNILWLSSLGAGIIRFEKNSGKFTFFTERQGLPNNTVYAMLPGQDSVFWCSSNKGIFSFDPQNFEVIQSFTEKDGLPGNEFNRFHFFNFSDGRLAFGGVDGYTVFNPSNIEKNVYETAIGFTGIEVNNVPADFGEPLSPFKQAVNSLEKIELSYDQNFLGFSFAAFEYNIPEKIKYRFRLHGYDNHWVMAGNDNRATYTKLPPGDYRFTINATNSSGRWSDYTKTIRVIIKPPFWQTWWFKICCSVLFIGIVYLFIRNSINKVRKEERQKLIFERESSELKAQALRAQMNPHFVFNCLNSIKALIQEDKKKEAVIYLTTFSKLIRSQLNNAQQAISLHEELETCKLYTQLESLRFGNRVAAFFNIDEKVDTHSLMIPPLLIQPFIENAIWHGIVPKGEGVVNIEVKKNGDMITCIISDDGIGREMAMRNKSAKSTYESKGMQLVKSRLDMFNKLHDQQATINITDKKDEHSIACGTLVNITFKQEV